MTVSFGIVLALELLFGLLRPHRHCHVSDFSFDLRTGLGYQGFSSPKVNESSARTRKMVFFHFVARILFFSSSSFPPLPLPPLLPLPPPCLLGWIEPHLMTYLYHSQRPLSVLCDESFPNQCQALGLELPAQGWGPQACLQLAGSPCSRREGQGSSG